MYHMIHLQCIDHRIHSNVSVDRSKCATCSVEQISSEVWGFEPLMCVDFDFMLILQY